ncbi:hypothetical protein [Amycolatopsis sp. GA6-003]|uniref:CRISPR-associated endonuclease Cas2 n=1 Tax=Amycolatopsis sp. GA6-003 TaxID=2652444 RepID=UPI0039171AA1
MAYDIADPARLRRVCVLMEDRGECLQRSVFLCGLSLAERAELKSLVTDVIGLGPLRSAPPIRTLGKPCTLPDPSAKIV